MSKKNVIVATATGTLDRQTEGFLRMRYGKAVKICIANSPWIFTNPKGLENIIVSNQHKGQVFIKEEDFRPEVVTKVKESGLVFGTIERSQTVLHNTIETRELTATIN